MSTEQAATNGTPTEANVSTLTVNLWLSVFFAWIPALIFFLTEKGKNSTIDANNRTILNFQIMRTIVGVAYIVPAILGAIPYVGWIIASILYFVLWAAQIVLFVFAIIAAVKTRDEVRAGRVYKYPFNLELVK